MRTVEEHLERLAGIIDDLGEAAVAVSGGVDSLTLAVFAHRVAPVRVSMFHAVSPAVPAEATERVQTLAQREGWTLRIIDANEFSDGNYRANPVNRCFYCKTSLYSAIVPHTHSQIVSGTNTDDLGEYRPGLDAAQNHGVRHPFVEAGIDKATVRAIARQLGLGAIAELPSAPCLSSRIETGIAIDPRVLRLVHAAEKLVTAALAPRTVRCRVRSGGVVIELDEKSLDALYDAGYEPLAREVSALFSADGLDYPVSFAAYRTGSAFLVQLQPA